jgi:hypothetical protein
MSDKAGRKPAMGWVVIALAIGMLIWVRLRLVTDIPRSVYAEPQQQEPATPAGDASSQDAVALHDGEQIATMPERGQ